MKDELTAPMLRQAWLLFSDLNARFNVLYEECVHIQDTVAAMLEPPLPYPNVLPGDPLPPRHRIHDFQSNPVKWEMLSNRQRSLHNLFNYVGSLIVAFDRNKTHFREAFEALSRTRRYADFFWFAAQRNFYNNILFEEYTEFLEHAHEKLIQMRDNSAGGLPQSILLRRWNSALYGEFLSGYSRHVDWETHLIWSLAIDRDVARANRQLDETRRRSFFIHSWTHIPASLVQRHRLLNAFDDHGEGTFSAVRSAFFYLEMPLLFPLLYHECAHTRLRTLDDGESSVPGSPVPPGGQTPTSPEISESLLRAAERLRILTQHPLPEEDLGFWFEWASEIWADAIAVALGRAGYLAALSVQTFAQSQAVYFDDHIGIPLDERGHFRHRIWDLARCSKHESFWDVRLRTAIWVYEQVWAEELGTENSSDLRDWIDSLRSAMGAYDRGGEQVFQFSDQHVEWWRFRRRQSERIYRVVTESLSPVLPVLRTYRRPSSPYELDKKIASTIETAIRGLYNQVFEDHGAKVCIPEQIRIEELSLRTKWCFSAGILKWMNAKKGADNIADAYADHVRNDGSGVVRVALEWILIRDSLYDNIADTIVGAPPGPYLKPLLGSEGAEILDDTKHRDKEEKKLALLRFLKGRRMFSHKGPIARAEILRAFGDDIDRYIVKPVDDWMRTNAALALDPIGQKARGLGAAEYRDLPLGTFAIGIIHPNFIARLGNQDSTGAPPFPTAITRVREFYKSADNRVEAALRKLSDEVGRKIRFNVKSEVLPLIGQYSFALFRDGVTPVERQDADSRMPEMMVKPRSVLQILGGCRLLRCNYEHNKCALNGCKPPDSDSFASISLIKYNYRWEVITLWKRLQESEAKSGLGAERPKYPAARLYLSSGWEDCILLLWHKDESDFWKTYEDLDLGSNRGCESVQTYLSFDENLGSNALAPDAFPEDLATTDVEAKQCHGPWPHCTFPQSDRWGRPFFRAGYERTGRYDCSVTWNARKVQEMGHILCNLPTEFWKKVDRLSISTEKCMHPTDSTSPGTVRFLAQIALNGSRWSKDGGCWHEAPASY